MKSFICAVLSILVLTSVLSTTANAQLATNEIALKQMATAFEKQLEERRTQLYYDLLDSADPASLARWIREEVAGALPQLDRIDLQETPGCGALLCWGEQGPALP